MIEPHDPFSRLDERGTRGGDADPRGGPRTGLKGGLTVACLPDARCASFELDGMGDVDDARFALERVGVRGGGGRGRGSGRVDTFRHAAHCSLRRPSDAGTRLAGTRRRVGHH